MSEEQQKETSQEQQQNDKELNFRKLEAKFERKLSDQQKDSENRLKQVQQEYENKLNEYQRRDTEDDDDDVYVDKKRLNKQFSDFERNLEKKFDIRAEEKANTLLQKKEREMWLKQNPDFYKTLEQHADQFAEQHADLAEDILRMPEGFDRQRLVYKNIKTLGMDKPKESIQEKVDERQRSPYYQPTGIGTSPQTPSGDFSPTGQKNAYEKMMELKSRLRI